MTHETVRAMIERGAKIRWFCEVGQGHYGEVNLKAIARAKGGAVTLINRRPFCKIPGCPGRVYFQDLSSAWPKKLDDIGTESLFAYTEAERARLMPLGYRMVDGRWLGPKTTKGPPSEESGPS